MSNELRVLRTLVQRSVEMLKDADVGIQKVKESIKDKKVKGREADSQSVTKEEDNEEN